MAHKTLVNGTSYEISGGKTLVNGTAYSISGGKTLVGGTAYKIGFGTPIGDLEVGSSVYMNVNGVSTEFLVVHQGLPDTTFYDTSCDGTWLLMKDLYTNTFVLGSDNYDYGNSYIHAYLNGEFAGLLDTNIQSAIKQVKIPYSKVTGSTSTSIFSGANGLSTKIFLLTGKEVGADIVTYVSYRTIPDDGAKLDYFTFGTDTTANNLRKAYYNGSCIKWWLRCPIEGSTFRAWNVNTSGTFSADNCTSSNSGFICGIRPALILPSEAKIDENFNVIA